MLVIAILWSIEKIGGWLDWWAFGLEPDTLKRFQRLSRHNPPLDQHIIATRLGNRL